jgi:hypothetical protein
LLKIQTADGHERLIAHLHHENIRVLEAIQQKFNGEMALWDLSSKQWVPLADFELWTAKEVDKT